MANLIADNQTVSRGVYGIAIREAARIPEDFIAAHSGRIDLAYSMGEPIAMIAEELRFRFEHRPPRNQDARGIGSPPSEGRLMAYTIPALLDFINDRLSLLREELDEAREFGVNTPGFNQTLGAIDELKLIIDEIQENA